MGNADACKRYYQKNKSRWQERARERYHRRREQVAARFLEIKAAVLTHYGKNETLQCCWRDCGVVDIDMLTLDHVNDDGATDRQSRGRTQGGGVHLYRALMTEGYPNGYQTLCANHQLKKELLRRRTNAVEE
jgi:5-methylcytosine-specific restriction endonuclease McrA